MIHIPLNARVECWSKGVGKSVNVVINPVTRNITNLVVEDKHFGHIKRLVPIELIKITTSDTIQLTCTAEEFSQRILCRMIFLMGRKMLIF